MPPSPIRGIFSVYVARNGFDEGGVLKEAKVSLEKVEESGGVE